MKTTIGRQGPGATKVNQLKTHPWRHNPVCLYSCAGEMENKRRKREGTGTRVITFWQNITFGDKWFSGSIHFTVNVYFWKINKIQIDLVEYHWNKNKSFVFSLNQLQYFLVCHGIRGESAVSVQCSFCVLCQSWLFMTCNYSSVVLTHWWSHGSCWTQSRSNSQKHNNMHWVVVVEGPDLHISQVMGPSLW